MAAGKSFRAQVGRPLGQSHQVSLLEPDPVETDRGVSGFSAPKTAGTSCGFPMPVSALGIKRNISSRV